MWCCSFRWRWADLLPIKAKEVRARGPLWLPVAVVLSVDHGLHHRRGDPHHRQRAALPRAARELHGVPPCGELGLLPAGLAPAVVYLHAAWAPYAAPDLRAVWEPGRPAGSSPAQAG